MSNGPTNTGRNAPTFGGATRGPGTGGGGAFPGFADNGARVGNKPAAAAPTAARSDHGHATLTAATATAMAALVVTDMFDGTLCYVTARDGWFHLKTAALTANTWDTIASATVGRQWHRINAQSLVSAAQTTWSVDCANSTGLATDDNTGIDDAHPLRSMSELGYRLRGAEIKTFVAIRFLSNQAAADVPIFDYQLATSSAFVQLSGVPTVLFSGTLSAVAQASNVAATADDNTVSCAGLAVSFTASGGLAKGVIYKRTNSTVLYWFALKETVAKTIRITRPMNASASAPGFPATNDTFQALQLPQLGAIKFIGNEQWKMFIELVDDRGVYADAIAQPIFGSHYYISTARIENDLGWYANLLINAAGFTRGGGPGQAVFNGVGFIGTGATVYVNQGCDHAYQNNSAIYLQGCGLDYNSNAQASGVSATGIHAYDATASIITCDYWSFFLFGFLSGTGNSIGALLRAIKWSQIAYFTAPGTVAGTTTTLLPILAGVTAVAAGVDIPENINGNGVYVTV